MGPGTRTPCFVQRSFDSYFIWRGLKDPCNIKLRGKNRYCHCHMSAFEACQGVVFPARVARRGKGKAQAKQKVKSKAKRGKKKAASSSEVSDDDEEEHSELQTQFLQVFGSGRSDKGDLTKQSEILEGICEEYPSDDQKTGVKRLHAEAVKKFIHSSGTRKAKQKLRDNPMLDWQVFKKKMMDVREYTYDDCVEEWDKLPTYADYEEDWGGPEKFRNRRSCPGWLTGDDKTRHLTENFEEKNLQERRKLDANTTTEEMQQAVKDCAFGFKGVANIDESTGSSEAASTSLTRSHLAGKTMVDMVKVVVQDVPSMPQSSPAKTEAVAPSIASSQNTKPVSEKQQTTPTVDVAVVRATIARELDASYELGCARLWNGILAAATALQKHSECIESTAVDITYTLLLERFNLGILYLGYELDTEWLSKEKVSSSNCTTDLVWFSFR